MKKGFGIFLSLILLLSAITTCGPKSKYTNRFESYKIVEDPKATTVTISAFSLGVPNPARTTILSLSEKGQAEFIKAIKEHSKENKKDFIKTLGTVITLDPQPPSILLDRTVFKRRIVFSIENTSHGPADRIERVKVTLSLKENLNEPKLQNWDMFSSKYETIDLGTLQYKQSNVFGLSASGSIPLSSPVELSANAQLSRDLQETILLKDRRVVSTGQLTPKHAVVIQEGAVGIDLTGNMTLDIEIYIPNTAIDIPITYMANLFENDRPNDGNKVRISRRYAQYPKFSDCPITADVTVDYILRHVKSSVDGVIETGEKSIAEGDDVVELITGQASIAQPVEIIPSSILEFPTWRLVLLETSIANGKEKPVRRYLHLDKTGLNFDSYENTAEFLSWLNKRKSIEVGGGKLNFVIKYLRKDDISRLAIERTILNKRTFDKTIDSEIKCEKES
ncbi:MAG: hypothetical protein WBD99_08350 [Thermodesulfobacteriota bacterium]